MEENPYKAPTESRRNAKLASKLIPMVGATAAAALTGLALYWIVVRGWSAMAVCVAVGFATSWLADKLAGKSA